MGTATGEPIMRQDKPATFRAWAARRQAIICAELVLGAVYLLYFLVTRLGAMFSAGDAARGVDVVNNLVFLSFRYSLLAAPVISGFLLVALRRARLSLLVMLTPPGLVLVYCLAEGLMG
jgi:hypothetical protein